MSSSSIVVARSVVILGLVLWQPHMVEAVTDGTPTAVAETPTPNVESELERYRKAVQEVAVAEVEYRKILEAASVTLMEYQKAVKAAADAEEAEPVGLGAAQAKILELASAAGLAVAAIFFGFFSVLVASMPGLPTGTASERQVKRLYWEMAHATAAGIGLSTAASVCAMVALGVSSSRWAWCAIVLGALAVGLVGAITVYFEVKLWQRTWRVQREERA